MSFQIDNDTLADELQAGNKEAFKKLFSTYYPRLQKYAMQFVTDTHAADDIVQECFLKLWEKREAIAFTSVQALLFKIVRNNCLNHLRNQVVKNKHFSTNEEYKEIWEQLYHTDFLNDPDYILVYKELQQQIDNILCELPERSKEIFEISRFEGLKNKEIAERLGISIKIVERHISRAIKLLNKKLVLNDKS